MEMEIVVFPRAILGEILKAGQDIRDNRSVTDVFLHLSEEVGELSTEIAIDKGYSKKYPGVDGIKGEAVDVLICAVDILYTHCKISETELESIIRKKLEKWKAKSKL